MGLAKELILARPTVVFLLRHSFRSGHRCLLGQGERHGPRLWSQILGPVDAEGVGAVVVPVADDDQVVCPAVVHDDVSIAAGCRVLQVVGEAPAYPKGFFSVPVPVSHDHCVGFPAVHVFVFGVASSEVIGLVDGFAPAHSRSVDAVAIPVADKNRVVLAAVMEHDVRVGGSGNVGQLPGVTPANSWGVDAVAVPVANKHFIADPAVLVVNISGAGRGIRFQVEILAVPDTNGFSCADVPHTRYWVARGGVGDENTQASIRCRPEIGEIEVALIGGNAVIGGGVTEPVDVVTPKVPVAVGRAIVARAVQVIEGRLRSADTGCTCTAGLLPCSRCRPHPFHMCCPGGRGYPKFGRDDSSCKCRGDPGRRCNARGSAHLLVEPAVLRVADWLTIRTVRDVSPVARS